MDDDDKYAGMFAGNRIGGMPTVKLNIIGEELNMLERGCRPLPASRLAPGPRVNSPMTRARQDAVRLRATQRPGTSMGLVGRIRGAVSVEAAFRRSGLDTDATRERMFGTEHACPASKDRFRSTYTDNFKFYKGADEISLYTTMRKSQTDNKSRYSQPSLGLKHVNTANATKKQNNLNSPRGGKLRREPRSNPFEKCPKWETTTTGTFKANWNARQTCYRRQTPAIQDLSPLLPSDT